ncbi:UNKNOWN [Stylonychia lemnae]|uniref:Leucine Rich Repeat family protein n=1 Tax=Stylonychia lemnae TaxID=5949 RepID=A0A078AWT2_STYLE|nr:UNKNOWN [Stylonychia lemnae]|eukprot:CDW86885.1 UNKNOWN [Stylonychia lemnae]
MQVQPTIKSLIQKATFRNEAGKKYDTLNERNSTGGEKFGMKGDEIILNKSYNQDSVFTSKLNNSYGVKRPQTENSQQVMMSKIKREIEERQTHSPDRRKRRQALSQNRKTTTVKSQRIKNYKYDTVSTLHNEYTSPSALRESYNFSLGITDGQQSLSQIDIDVNCSSERGTAEIISRNQKRAKLAYNNRNPSQTVLINQSIAKTSTSQTIQRGKLKRPQSNMGRIEEVDNGQLNMSGAQHKFINPYSSFEASPSILASANINSSLTTINNTKFKSKINNNRVSYVNGNISSNKIDLIQSQANQSFNTTFVDRRTRNSSYGGNSQILDILKESCYSTKKSSAVVKIDMRNTDKVQCLNENEILRIFQARNLDLGLSFFDQQYQRFKDYCQKTCINRKIKLMDLGMGVNAAIELSQIIAVNQNIVHLDLKKNLLGDEGCKILIKAVSKSKSLVHLDLSSNQITHKGAKKIFTHLIPNSSLISLKLGSIDGVNKNKVGQKGIVHLVNLLQFSKFLQFLDLRCNILSDNGIISLCDAIFQNKTLVSLNLASNEITSYGMDRLKDTLLSTEIKELDLSGNPLGNQGIEYLSHYIHNNNCYLERLNVSECKFQSPGSVLLFQAVRKSSMMKHLSLDKNDIRSRSTSYLTTGIYHGLVYLSMNRCNLGDDGGISVAEGLSRSKQLKYMFLQYNSLSDEAAKTFSEALIKSSINIEHLDLSHNKINDAGGELIAMSMSQNKSLSKLNLKRNNLKITSGAMFAKSVKSNKQIQYLNLDGNSVNINFIEEIAEILLQNMIRASKNKIPQYKSEVVQLKLDHEKGFSTTQNDIQNCKKNKLTILEDIKRKQSQYEVVREDEKYKNDEIEEEKKLVDKKYQEFQNYYIDEEQKIKAKQEAKEQELQLLQKWVTKQQDINYNTVETIKETKIAIQRLRKEQYEERLKMEQTLILEETSVIKAEKQYNAVKIEHSKYAPQLENNVVEEHLQADERFDTDTNNDTTSHFDHHFETNSKNGGDKHRKSKSKTGTSGVKQKKNK